MVEPQPEVAVQTSKPPEPLQPPPETALKQRSELTGPKEKSETFKKIRETLRQRLDNKSKKTTEESEEPNKPNHSGEILKIMDSITRGEVVLITDVVLEDSEDSQGKDFGIQIVDEKIKVLKVVKKEDQQISFENFSQQETIPNIKFDNLYQALIPKLNAIFPDLTSEQQQAIAQAILNQEKQPAQLPAQLEQLGEFLGYVSCRQIEAILGISEDQKQELISKFKGKKLDEFKEPLERAQAQYFALTQPKEGQEKPDVSVVFTEAKSVIEILEQLNPSAKDKRFKEIIQTIVDQQNQVKKESQKVEEFAEQYGLTELLDQSLSDIVTTHYTDIQNGNESEKFTKGTFAKLTEILMQNKVISDAKRKELIKKFENGGKFVGILAIVMALLLWKSSQEGSQGGGGMH